MQESIGTNDSLKRHTIENGDVPINYCSADVNGKEMAFFISKNDCFAAKNLGVEIPSAAVAWINRSNFTVNRECAEAGVKDFNDLLKKTKSFDREMQKINEWIDKATTKADEREKQYGRSAVCYEQR